MELFPQQRKALVWCNGKDNFACFMEMRTGKSLVAIEQAKRWGGGVILIAPISTWYDWKDLLFKQGIAALFLDGPTIKKRQKLHEHYCCAEWIVINPEGLTRWGKEFFQAIGSEFCTCILDESVFIKNPRAKITKLLLRNKDRFEHRMVMTGTPIAEITEDVVSQLIWCNGDFMGYTNFYAWRCNYMRPSKFKWTLKKGIKPLLRDTLKQESFIMSAHEAGLFTQQVQRTHLVEMPNHIREDYDEIEKAWMLGEASTKFGIVKDIWLARLACGIYPKELEDIRPDVAPFKIAAIKELLHGELKDQQVIIFSRWLKEVWAISTALKCPCITGQTPFDARDNLLANFRERVFPYLVVQSKTACRGLDLSCVNTAIMCSNYWQHEIRSQILARLKHPNKRIPTLFIDLITKNTIEEKVYEVLQEKYTNARYFLQRIRAKYKCRKSLR